MGLSFNALNDMNTENYYVFENFEPLKFSLANSLALSRRIRGGSTCPKQSSNYVFSQAWSMSLESLTIIRILTPVSSCIEQGVLWTGIIKSKVNQCKALLSTRKCQRVVMMCDSGVACVDVENRFESALRYDGRVAL